MTQRLCRKLHRLRPLTRTLILLLAACSTRHVRPVDAPGTPATCDRAESLSDVLEAARLEGTCDDYAAGKRDEATRLRCGKWMFFRETFGTAGIPSSVLRFNLKHFAGYYGQGFEKMGLIPDPDSEEGMPLGLAPGHGSTHAFTCAACHFAQLPDGTYAVGPANERFDYGRMIASLGAPLSVSFDPEAPGVAPVFRAEVKDHVAAAKLRSGYLASAGLLGLSLMTSSAPLSVADQERFHALAPGTMDFLTAPMLDDGVWTVSRTLPLWNLRPADDERLSWNGGVHTLMQFIHGFAAIGVGETWTDDRLIPLRDYIYTLKSPPSPHVPSAQGATLFTERGCAKCHDGPDGEGTRVFTFAELGTDPAYGDIYAPGPDGYACCGLKAGPDAITRGVKAPKLKGLWATKRFLHNGSVEGLDALFCRAPRAKGGGRGQTAGGHTMTCDGLTDDEKLQLIAFLEAW